MDKTPSGGSNPLSPAKCDSAPATAIACRDREQEKNTRERGPEAMASPARPFRPPHDLVKAETEEPRHHLTGEAVRSIERI
jgi:hypothetical protein